MAIRLILFLLILSPTLYGQIPTPSSYAPYGSHWNYWYTSLSGDNKSFTSIRVIDEYIQNGYWARLLVEDSHRWSSSNPNEISHVSRLLGMLHIKNDSMWFYDQFPYDGQFLFSFSMNIGDTIVIRSTPSKLIAVVDSLSTVTLQGETLQRWVLSKYCNQSFFGTTTIIENIGPIDDYLFWNTDGCPVGAGKWTFQCFSSPTLKYNEPCEPVIVGIEPAAENQTFKLFPNPADDQLRLISPVPFKEVILYNQLGQRLKTINFPLRKQTVINLHELASGPYVVLIKGDEVEHSKSFLIQR